MIDNLSSFDITIIITQELHARERGYSLVGREFVIKDKTPREDEAIHLDGKRVKDHYWVVSKEEYLRVVPEAGNVDVEEVYIPTFVARVSFRPKRLRKYI